MMIKNVFEKKSIRFALAVICFFAFAEFAGIHHVPNDTACAHA
jgi:hypothetical protein